MCWFASQQALLVRKKAGYVATIRGNSSLDADRDQGNESYLESSARVCKNCSTLARVTRNSRGHVQQLMQALNLAYQNDGELTQRFNREVLPDIKRLELELRRKLNDKNGDQVRSAGSETIPQGYSGAVADYFRKLSKSK